jgi:uncharacterized membrane protein YjgN (DUF898 family)
MYLPTTTKGRKKMKRQFQFNGTGGELFVKLLVGGLLSAITFGIYAPWFVVSLTKYIYEKTVLKTGGGEVRFEFNGTGGQLFVTWLVGAILTGITFGIYGAWFMVKLTNFFATNLEAKSSDGKVYNVEFRGTGGQLFVIYLVGVLLSMITLGIYAPWFMCKLTGFFYENTGVMLGGQKVGGFSFIGTGGSLFVTYLVGAILTCITFGIYGSWFMVKLFKFFTGNTEIDFENAKYVGAFEGTGGQYFVLNLVGGILTGITFGIYGAWYMVKQIRFQCESTVILDKA